MSIAGFVEPTGREKPVQRKESSFPRTLIVSRQLLAVAESTGDINEKDIQNRGGARLPSRGRRGPCGRALQDRPHSAHVGAVRFVREADRGRRAAVYGATRRYR